MKIVVISDTHFRSDSSPLEIKERKGYLADLLLMRAVQRCNRLLKPDLVLFAGDLLDRGDLPHAEHELQRMRNIMDKLQMPYIAIPGNHDGDVNHFYKLFPKPPPQMDIKNVRILTFIDPEAPGYNATRTTGDIKRMRQAREGWAGPIVMLQHVPIFPPDKSDCPYNYTNVDEILGAMKEAAIDLAISGHYHYGMDLISHERQHFLAAPALCEKPFRLLQVQITPRIEVQEHSLSLPRNLHLRDWHAHTSFAYCSENMEVETALQLATEFNLGEISFAEHSGHLYCDKKNYWSRACLEMGTSGIDEKNLRIDDFFQSVGDIRKQKVQIGLEADCCFDGELLLRSQDRQRADFIIGAVHQIPELKRRSPVLERVCDEFLFMVKKTLEQNVDILAHPFRVFHRAGFEEPEWLYEPVVKLLKLHNCAAELNFHTNEPPPLFFKRCIESGVPVSLGSDSHNLYEVGDFALHLNLLENIGCESNLQDVLLI